MKGRLYLATGIMVGFFIIANSCGFLERSTKDERRVYAYYHAFELQQHFEKNEEESLINRVINVHGNLVGIEVLHNGKINILLKTLKPETKISCRLSDHSSPQNITKLKYKQAIRVQGTLLGELQDIILVDCQLIAIE